MIDYQAIVAPALPILYWLIPVMLLIGFLKSPTVKGWLGELALRIFSRLTLPKETYRRLYNVTLPTPDGTTQIDHIFVSPYGIFVVETKNMKGWIFGSEKQSQWTQRIYKRSYKFQNPLRQNYKHTKAIENLLDVPPETIHSVVCFVGDSRFKTPMPDNVTHGLGSVRYIKSFKTKVFSDQEMQQIVDDLQAGRKNDTRETHREHVANLRTNHDSDGQKQCPKCGEPMVLRAVKRGASEGKEFRGCSGFPNCRYRAQRI